MPSGTAFLKAFSFVSGKGEKESCDAENGKYGLVKLEHRHQDIQLPEIQVVDIKDLQRRKMMNGLFSPTLLIAVRKALANGEQAIIFQNRRGFAPMVECKVCGWVPKCEHCDVSLTYHRRMNVLTCHYCGATYRVPVACPCCEEKQLRDVGYGTEKIEDDIRELFPKASISSSLANISLYHLRLKPCQDAIDFDELKLSTMRAPMGR